MFSPISIQPLGPDDFHLIAALEGHAFNDDPITIYAFGPNRASPIALQKRAHSLANPPSYPPIRMRKAVTSSGQVVGFALWKFYTDPMSLDGQDGDQDQRPGNVTDNESKWPEDANVQLCETVFGMSDELCKLAMRGKKYAGTLHLRIVILRA